MHTNYKYSVGSILLLILSLTAFNVEAGRGGGGIGGDRGGFNNNGIRDNNGYNNVYNNNGYNYRHDDSYNAAVVIDAGNGSSCQTNQVCNSYGQCTTEEDCDQ